MVDRCVCGQEVPLSDVWWHRTVCPGAAVNGPGFGSVATDRSEAMAGMVEAVARAIAMEEGVSAAPGAELWRSYVGDAEAALAVLQEPTIEMIGAGAVAGAVSNDAAAAVWGAMMRCARGKRSEAADGGDASS